MKIVGIDLATEKGKTGFCFLKDRKIETSILKTDKEIIEKIKSAKANVIAIDAPLSLPRDGKTRKAEKELRKMGIRVYPPLIPSMRNLTLRGIKLRKKLEKKYRVIEVYPGIFYDKFGIPRKKNRNKLIKLFKNKFGIKAKGKLNQHELDAITAAVIGKLFLKKKTVAVGDQREGQIIIIK